LDLFDEKGRTMTRTIDTRDSTAALPTELAHRSGDGLDVLLQWHRDDGRLTVVVADARSDEWFELTAADGRLALEAFYHPFAYAAAHGVSYRRERDVTPDDPPDEPAAPARLPRRTAP
jgi:hypothetical protein